MDNSAKPESEPTVKIELTKNETDQLVGLIDQAVKSGGIVSAMSAVPIFKKLQEAAKNVQS